MVRHVSMGGAATRQAATLTPAEEATLELIARLPLVPVRSLLPLSPAGSTAALYRRVAGLARRGLVAAIDGPPASSGPRGRLLLLDNFGLAVLACRRDAEPAVLARAFGLHRARLAWLARRLPAVLSTYELLALLARAGEGPARLRAWRQPWQWSLQAARAAAPRVRLPAWAALEWTTPRGQLGAACVLIADPGGLSPAAVRPDLARLGRVLRACGEVGPTVVIATTSVRRVQAWRNVLESVGSSWRGGPLDGRVATWDAWRAGREKPPLGCPSGVAPARRPAPHSGQERPTRASVLCPIDVDRVRVSVGEWRLSSGQRAVLDVLGRHPFLPTGAIGDVLGKSGRWEREQRTPLLRRGLVRVVPLQELPSDLRLDASLLEATRKGLTLLAGSLGLSLAGAVRYQGLTGGGPARPIGPRRPLLRHLAHTLGADAFILALARAARREPGGALVEWQNAAACVHGRVRPDGYGLLRIGHREYGFFVEFDRGTVRPAALRAKFASYQRYRSSARALRDYDGFPTVLVVTTGPGAEERLRRAVQAAGNRRGGRPVVLLTTVGWIEGCTAAPFGPIWLDPERGIRVRWPVGTRM